MNLINKKGISNGAMMILLGLLAVILFFVAPKYLDKAKSASQETDKKPPVKNETGYVESYHKGMSRAQAAVDASRERYGKN